VKPIRLFLKTFEDFSDSFESTRGRITAETFTRFAIDSALMHRAPISLSLSRFSTGTAKNLVKLVLFAIIGCKPHSGTSSKATEVLLTKKSPFNDEMCRRRMKSGERNWKIVFQVRNIAVLNYHARFVWLSIEVAPIHIHILVLTICQFYCLARMKLYLLFGWLCWTDHMQTATVLQQ